MTDDRGHKAAGLERLPCNWYPRYVALPAGLAAAIAADDAGSSGTRIATRLRASDISQDLTALFDESPDGVLVRSSALDEDINARGLYLSVPTTFASFQTVGEAIRAVWKRVADLSASGPIPLLIQTRVVPTLSGHLSNESRLRRDRRDWVVEIQGESSLPIEHGLRASRVDRVPASSIDLGCTSPQELRAVLRRVAGAFTQPGTRTHFEWLWDGTRVWIVQCDTVAELRTAEPTVRGVAGTLPHLSTFRAPTVSDADIPKIRCISDYIAAGIDHARLVVLRDPTIIDALARGECPAPLADDLAKLAATDVVIRSDYARGNHDFETLLPRTETEHSAPRLHRFLVDTARLLRRKGVPSADIVFLAHPFIPAAAAAWSLAAPQSPEVRVDGTYGLPDGLLYYTHDSFVANVRRGRVRKRIRAKETIVCCGDDGVWRTVRVGAPWNWRPALTDDEVLSIARISKQLADHLRRPVETMFFVRAQTSDGPIDVLPWVHRTDTLSSGTVPATESHFPAGSAISVRTPADLAALRHALATVEPGERLLIRLKPEGSVLHDGSFLESVVAELSAERCVVELAGSGLSHVFYELQRAGVQVQTDDPIGPSATDPQAFDKLVRDLIPDTIAARGERVVSYEADEGELLSLLRRKIIEEAFEAAGAISTNELIEELGDLLDVIDALCTVSGTTLAQVMSWAASKRTERGGFARGLVLLETRDTLLEEALAESLPDFSLRPDLGAEVARARSTIRRTESRVLEQELEIPFSSPVPTGGDFTRVLIDGHEFHISFRPSGVLITRAARVGEDPRQLSLPL